MSWADVSKLTVRGDGYAIFNVFDLVSGSLYSLDDHDATNSFNVQIEQDVELQFASEEAAAADVISIDLDNSVTIETPARKKYIDGLSGAEKTASGSNAVESIVVTILDSSTETLRKIQAAKSKPIILTVGLGKSPSGLSRGSARIMGKITGGFSRKTQSNTYTPIALTISGGIAYDKTGGSVTYSTYNAAVSDPTPVGEDSATTIADLTSDQFNSVLAGNIVLY